MKVHVKFFAVARDQAGVAETTLNAADHSTVADVAQLLVERHPGFSGLLPRVAFAVNMNYVRRDHVLSDGDELAVIPPVSGG